MDFLATVTQLASLSGNSKINCLSCLINELSPLTPHARLRRRSRVRGHYIWWYQSRFSLFSD
ncbi:Leucine--tRNA ligase [Gossypium arboreum]|uniref:Leucine--tRNA ligase n=1 Tax=Gossypium arboreum TaxID=29729 RepID=A0A0B0NHG3_GOSAR|nr:Leucine--tRNA ligase [Gossypium arboreum]